MNNTVVWYPDGAIKTEDDLVFALIGSTVYVVNARGSKSTLYQFSHEKRIINCPIINKRRLESYSGIGLYLGDYNIGSNHSNSFLFYNEKLAVKYFNFAKHEMHYTVDNINKKHYI